MKLRFIKFNPTRNMTILVTDSVPRNRHGEIAAKLMDYGSVGAEQVGYLEAPADPRCRIRLQMMGGEFCGNASMSAGAYLAMRDNLADGAEVVYPLEVSGADKIIECRIARRGTAFTGTVDMSLPESIEDIDLDGVRAHIVRFSGIAHAIVPADRISREDAEARIRAWRAAIGADALGILRAMENDARIEPLVYVQSTDSAVWEQGCGSGSAAMGAYIAFARKTDADICIDQPGGRIRVQAEYARSAVRRIRITGTVKIAAEGCAYID